MSDYIGIKTIPFADGTDRVFQSVTGTSSGDVLPRVPAGKKSGWGAAPDAPGAVTVALAGAGAGNVDNGDHKYKVTLVTSEGETAGGTASATVTVVDKTVNGKVAVSAIPTGNPSVVLYRKLYRSKVGDLTTFFLLATITDNTTTTYTDNTADASLGAAVPTVDASVPFLYLRRPSKILVDCDVDLHLAFGEGSLPTATTSYEMIKAGERQVVDVPPAATHYAVIRDTSSGTFGMSVIALYMDRV
jgi:hypothetical protein